MNSLVQHISTIRELNDILGKSGSRLVVIDFSASWCGPCNAIAPFFDQLSFQYKGLAEFLKVDIDTAERYLVDKYQVHSVPTFKFFQKGIELKTLSGANKIQLEENIKQYTRGIKIIEPKTFPIINFLSFEIKPEHVNLVLNNIEKNNNSITSTDNFRLNEDEMSLLNQALNAKSNENFPQVRLIFEKLFKWEPSMRFPIYDAFRIVICDRNFADELQKVYSSDSPESNVFKQFLIQFQAFEKPLEKFQEKNYIMMWRALANSFLHLSLRSIIMNEEVAKNLLESCSILDSSTDKQLHIAVTTVLLNMILDAQIVNPQACSKNLLTLIIQKIIVLLSKEEEDNSLYRLLVAMGTLIYKNSDFRVLLSKNQLFTSYLKRDSIQEKSKLVCKEILEIFEQ